MSEEEKKELVGEAQLMHVGVQFICDGDDKEYTCIIDVPSLEDAAKTFMSIINKTRWLAVIHNDKEAMALNLKNKGDIHIANIAKVDINNG